MFYTMLIFLECLNDLLKFDITFIPIYTKNSNHMSIISLRLKDGDINFKLNDNKFF